jgi:SAGA-associated factor 11
MKASPQVVMDMPDLFEPDDDDEQAQPSDPYEEVMLELIDEISLGLCFETHRSCKLGTYFLDETDSTADEQFALVTEHGRDVFGQVPMKKQVECVCPNCNRNIAAARFAPHLEKCMGMGRNSSRIASRRIANANAKKDDDDNDGSDHEADDNDWSYAADRKVKKLKRDRNNHSGSPRRGKNKKNLHNGDNIPSVGSTKSDDSGLAAYENMLLEDRKALLLNTCGVISEHTKRMCTRSSRCPQHTDEQRRAVRQYLLHGISNGSAAAETDALGAASSEVVDIDTLDDTDSQLLRDTLQWEVAAASPADSTSTTSSIKVTKKRKHNKGKKKNKSSSSTGNGNSGGSRGSTPTASMLLGYLVSK